jgi:hypothetical protein
VAHFLFHFGKWFVGRPPSPRPSPQGEGARYAAEDKPGVVFPIDLDDRDEVVGVELIGVKEFTIGMLQKFAKVEAPNIDFERTKFAPVAEAINAR